MSQQRDGDVQIRLREHLRDLLGGANAHLDFASAVKDLKPPERGRKPSGSPHTPWQLLEHLRIAQRDILDFCRDGRHKSPKWPDSYWPKESAPPDEHAWDESVAHFQRDLQTFIDLIGEPQNDLFAPIPGAPKGQTLLREALVLADHNSYHIGQIVLLRKMREA